MSYTHVKTILGLYRSYSADMKHAVKRYDVYYHISIDIAA